MLPDAYPYLTAIEASLENMRDKASASRAQRERMAGGLGRVVTEDYAFSEGALGTRLLEVADAFVEMDE